MKSALAGVAAHAKSRKCEPLANDNKTMVVGSDLTEDRAQLVIATKAMIRDVLQVKLRIELSCDSSHNILWSRWPSNILEIIDTFHYFPYHVPI